ncbi:MAG: ABC transporter ATP-binding protein, partial [Synergistaceae bacterium]|nr:ABC transporter ATP-binding protein [Synergistaceae bacterium]
MKNNLRHLWPYIRSCVATFCVAPLFVLAEVMAELAQPNLMAKIVNERLAGGDSSLLVSGGIRMIFLTVFGLGCGVLSMILSASASNRFGAALRCGLYRRIQTFSFADIESFHTGSLITRLTSDTTLLQQLSQSVLRIFIRAPLMLAGSIFMALQVNRSLISVLVLLIPVLTVIIVSVFKRAFPLFVLTQKRLDRLNTVVQENLAGVRVVKAFSGELREKERFREANTALCDVSLRSGRIVILLIPLLMLAMHLGVVAVVALGAAGVQAGGITVGDIMAYI